MDSGDATMMFELDMFLPYRLAVASSHVSREFAALYRKEFDISIPEWRILAHLSQMDEASVRDIHERVDMDKSKVSRAATRLEQAGLVRKQVNADDRRLVVLSLTLKGRDLICRIKPIALAFQAQLYASLGKTAPALAAGLDRLIDRTSEA